MKKTGFRNTKSAGPKHQDCSTCHPELKSGAKRSRRGARAAIGRGLVDLEQDPHPAEIEAAAEDAVEEGRLASEGNGPDMNGAK